MKFSLFADYLHRLESTTKRLEITAILGELISELDPKEVDKATYLSLGLLKASYENPKFNIAEKMMARILEFAYRADGERIREIYTQKGDLGDVAYELATDEKEKTPSIEEVHEELLKLALVEGTGSQESKVKKMSSLLEKLDKTSAKFVVRIVLGTTRLGFTELTVIDALNKACNGDKGSKLHLENVYNTHPDIGQLVKVVKEKGLDGVKELSIETGVPILPQRCQRLSNPEEIIEKMGKVAAEYKLDGTRVQLHMDRNKRIKSKDDNQNSLFSDKEDDIFVKTYTRNLEETTHQYPDITEAALEQIDADSVILDGEAIGYSKETGEFLPFQEIMQRKRKHGIAEMALEIPLRYFVFDILYLNGKSLIALPFHERREIILKIIKKGKVIEVIENLETEDPQELAEYFESSKEKNLEGLVVKKIDDVYQAGARAYSWIKYKRADTKILEDTIDVVILGYYHGKGVRAEFGIGGFLAGVYDKGSDTFKTITKVGTGLKDEDFISLKKKADKLKVDKKPAMVEASKIFEPDVWIKPEIVVVLGADEVSKSSTHTAGYALRFPRLMSFREDKSPEDITTVAEIEGIHQSQKRGNY